MEINPKIKEILESFGVPYQDGLSYLLSVHFQCIPSYVPENLVRKIMVSNILGIQSGKTVFIVPLFTSQDVTDNSKWAWVSAYRDLFKNISSVRAGSLSTCVTRMKAFFAENPDVRKEEVIGATQLYIRNVSEKTFLKTSHKFIYDGQGKMKNSDLENWIDRYRAINSVPETPQDSIDVRDRLQ